MKYIFKGLALFTFFIVESLLSGFLYKRQPYQKSEFYINFTLNGTKFHFDDASLDRMIFVLNKEKSVLNKELSFDTNKILAVQFSANGGKGNTQIRMQFVVQSDSQLIAGNNYCIFGGKSYFLFGTIQYTSKGIVATQAGPNNPQNAKIIFSRISASTVKGIFSGNIGQGNDSLITDGTFNVRTKQEE